MILKNKRKKYIKRTLLIILIVYVFTGLYHWYFKPLPIWLNIQSEIHDISSSQVTFLHDDTYQTELWDQVIKQEIFDTILSQIEAASSYILIDMFFFSDFTGTEKSSYRALSGELTNALVQKKQTNPDIVIQVITDPINTMYGWHHAEHLSRLQDNNISVIITDLSKLRDSNPLYSPSWRWAFRWLWNSQQWGWIQNAMDVYKPELTLRSYLHAWNYKANHRKVLVTDSSNPQDELITLITSANPHDWSSEHSNVGFQISGNLGWDVVMSEQAVAKFSGYELKLPDIPKTTVQPREEDTIRAQLFTEKSIKTDILQNIWELQDGDSIDILMFYFSDRDIINALKTAAHRGVKVKVLMDPNKDAFGRTKDGTPNRQVASELHKHGVEVRWCNTHGEQCHGKMLLFSGKNKNNVMLGSANLTRRNIDNYNLESNISLSWEFDFPAYIEAYDLFENLWNNENWNMHSLDYSDFKNESTFDYIKYWLQEISGFSRF